MNLLFSRFRINPLKAIQACMRSHTAPHPYSRTHATPGLGVCFMSELPHVCKMSLAPQHCVQTFIQCCPFIRSFLARPGLILLGLMWASYPYVFLLCLQGLMMTVPRFLICSVRSMIPLRH